MKCFVRVLKTSSRGFCAGAIRCIETLNAALQCYGRPCARYASFHNPAVAGLFEQRGVVFFGEFGAHRVACKVREARRSDLTTIDATCPLVSKVDNDAPIPLLASAFEAVPAKTGSDEGFWFGLPVFSRAASAGKLPTTGRNPAN